jgi:hypothetical protein
LETKPKACRGALWSAFSAFNPTFSALYSTWVVHSTEHLFLAACHLFLLCSNSDMNDHPASWRMPTPAQMQKMATGRSRTSRVDDSSADEALPKEYWDAVLRDPRAAGKPWLPIEQMRLSEIPRELLRVDCSRCGRAVEIQRLDAVKLYGPQCRGVPPVVEQLQACDLASSPRS